MDQARAAQLLELAVKDAVARLIEQGREVSPTIIGSVAAGIAEALDLGARTVGGAQGVRFLTGNSPAIGWMVPAQSLPPLSPLAPVLREPGASVPIGPPEPLGPVPIGPHPGHPSPGGPQPFGPTPGHPSPRGPQPIGPTPGHPSPSGPQPIGPHPGHPSPSGPRPIGPTPGHPSPTGPQPTGPQPTGPQPTGPQPTGPTPGRGGLQHPQPGGELAPLEPQAVDPIFVERVRDKFGVIVFENIFKLEVANHLGVIVQSQRQALRPLVRRSPQRAHQSLGFKFLGLPQTPEYVKSIFDPLLSDMIEFAANRFKLKPPKRYRTDVRVMVTPPGGGSVAYTDSHEPGGEDRQVTWIYFVASTERYQGGDLLLYEVEHPTQLLSRLTRRITVPPTTNALIMFPSALVHEVTPVVAPHAAGATRPTIQGWLRWSK